MKSLLFILLIASFSVYGQKKNSNGSYNLPPTQSSKLLSYGFTELDNGNYKRAIELASQSIELNPNQYLAYYLRAEANMYVEDHDRNSLLSDLDMCLKLNPHFSAAYYTRYILEEYEDKVKAYDDITSAIKYSNNNELANYYSSRASLLIDMLDWIGALKDVNTALKLDSKNENAYRSRGRIWIEQGKYLQAINDLDKAVNLMPTGDGFVFFYRGLAKAKLKKMDSACADFARAKEIIKTAQFDETIEKYCK